MLYPSADKLKDFPSRYVLAILAAKRAKQIKEGAQRLVDTDATHPLTIALEEIASGKIRPRVLGPDVLVEEAIGDAVALEPMAEEIATEALAAMSIVEQDETTGELVPAAPRPTLLSLLDDPTTEEQIAMDDEQLQEEITTTQGTELFGAPTLMNRTDILEAGTHRRDSEVIGGSLDKEGISYTTEDGEQSLLEDENTDLTTDVDPDYDETAELDEEGGQEA